VTGTKEEAVFPTRTEGGADGKPVDKIMTKTRTEEKQRLKEIVKGETVETARGRKIGPFLYRH